MVKLSIIAPTYNEIDNLAKFVETIYGSLENSDFELIIVDDNSPDGTGKLADNIAMKRGNMKVVHRRGKMGLGTAILEGTKIADGAMIATIDADLQHPPELLKIMWKKAEDGADIVIASRYVEGGKIEGWSLIRRAISKGALWLSHLLLPRTRKIKDTQSGYFLFKKRVIENVDIDVRDFKLLVEILAKGKYKEIAEVPFSFGSRGAGKSKLGIKEVVSYLKQLLRLSKYRTLKFMTVGTSGIAVNNGVLWLLISSANVQPLLADVFSIEASIISNFLLNNFWTFRGREGGKFPYKLIKYHGSVTIGAIINFVTFALLLTLGLNIIIANTIGIILGFISNYFLSEFFVWKWPTKQ